MSGMFSGFLQLGNLFGGPMNIIMNLLRGTTKLGRLLVRKSA